ncbi:MULTISPECIES: hypothetical protein [unclassified Wolbachia]|uniref:hypothetical protein n=1 Tax=unclassified Wolbachia TaxID=2640676 RepID=UPI0031335655
MLAAEIPRRYDVLLGPAIHINLKGIYISKPQKKVCVFVKKNLHEICEAMWWD